MKVKLKSAVFHALCGLATVVSLGSLFLLLVAVAKAGLSGLEDVTSSSGILLSVVGSLWLLVLTAIIAVPIGVGTAIYLEEYAPKNRLRSLIELNISNLAGVPSVVYGILGLGLFVRAFGLDRSLLSGALTLSLVILPIIIMASQEALRSVPASIRNASFALGATKWQTIWRQVLPIAAPAITTGVILALSRAIGEAAPLLIVGAVFTATFLPTGIWDEFSALPIKIFDLSNRSQGMAGSTIIVLLFLLICMNAIAVFIRYRFSKQVDW